MPLKDGCLVVAGTVDKTRQEYLVCECSSESHTLRFWFFDATDRDFETDVYISVHLMPRPFWQRVWTAVCYILGADYPESHYGSWNLSAEAAPLLRAVCDDFLAARQRLAAKRAMDAGDASGKAPAAAIP